jgi:hypothetical protein
MLKPAPRRSLREGGGARGAASPTQASKKRNTAWRGLLRVVRREARSALAEGLAEPARVPRPESVRGPGRLRPRREGVDLVETRGSEGRSANSPGWTGRGEWGDRGRRESKDAQSALPVLRQIGKGGGGVEVRRRDRNARADHRCGDPRGLLGKGSEGVLSDSFTFPWRGGRGRGLRGGGAASWRPKPRPPQRPAGQRFRR